MRHRKSAATHRRSAWKYTANMLTPNDELTRSQITTRKDNCKFIVLGKCLRTRRSSTLVRKSKSILIT